MRSAVFLRDRIRLRVADDQGVSLVEMLVGTIIMGIFMTIFTYSMISMYASTSKAEAISATASQLSQAFDRLDGSIRYAAAISTPGQVAGDWYVEWRSDYATPATCTQLRLNNTTHVLALRTWTVDSPGVAPSWQALASQVRQPDDDTGEPFTVPTPADADGPADAGGFYGSDGSDPEDPTTGATHQTLTVSLVAAATTRTGETTSASQVTYTALNSVAPAPTDSVCAGRRGEL